MKQRRVSLIVFYTKDWKILLQDRAFKNDPKVEWGFFWGGIEEWETPEQALVRETKEELSFDLKDYKFIWTHKAADTNRSLEVEQFIYISPLNNINGFHQNEWDDMMLITPKEAKEKLKMDESLDHPVLDMIEKELMLIL